MKFIEKRPMIMIAVGVIGISLSSIFVRLSAAPSAVTAAWRLLWTVILMTPAVAGNPNIRREMAQTDRKTLLLSFLSGAFLAIHFAVWFESLRHTTVASSTTIVCTEVIWVSLGYCLFLKGKLSKNALFAIAITLFGSICIAWADSGAGGVHLYGDFLALIAAIAVAVYTLLGRLIRQKTSTTVYTYLCYFACALVLLTICAVNGQNLLAYGPSAIVVGLLLSLFSTILGHSIFSWCLRYFSPSFVSASKLCEPVISAMIAAVLFAEIPALLQIFGGMLILGGVLYYSKIEEKQ